MEGTITLIVLIALVSVIFFIAGFCYGIKVIKEIIIEEINRD